MEQKIITLMGKPGKPALAPLPEAFAELNEFVGTWALASETGRTTQRHTVGMPAIVAFKDAMLPRVDELVAWLNQYRLDSLPDEAKTAMYLLLSFAEIAPAVEFYQQPNVIDGYDPFRFAADESFAMRPAI
ncbi:hypothetical protein NOV72_05776 [Caballeronia novacaledonica]|uniref:Uncharacterized protein n=1 Tax=Caballeronia novacaledonica TaxID=1544861 RepID=A0A2U3IED9_9BURK|nr:hypothetical protein [Caballeronia novacaledonica]SPB18576.1 hypothetical protein NOV72_05776 [Caballeronia novacaledonica]